MDQENVGVDTDAEEVVGWEICWGRGGPQSVRMSEELGFPFWVFLPLTRLAKSASSAGVSEEAMTVVEAPPQPPLVVCLEVVRVVPFVADSSWSLRVCSLSIRDDRALMRVM